jgi:hypothetical protein
MTLSVRRNWLRASRADRQEAIRQIQTTLRLYWAELHPREVRRQFRRLHAPPAAQRDDTATIADIASSFAVAIIKDRLRREGSA